MDWWLRNPIPSLESELMVVEKSSFHLKTKLIKELVLNPKEDTFRYSSTEM